MATPQATPAKKDPEVLDKLAEGYRYVTIPNEDIYEAKFDGIWLNQKQFKPGTHLVPAAIADTLEERLKVWNTSMIRLMRPGSNRDTVKTMAKQGLFLAADGAPPEA